MRKRITQLTKELDKLMVSRRFKLNKNELKAVPADWGLYRILIPRSDRTLYVGKSVNIKRRLRDDLLTLSGSHTLKNKLMIQWKLKRNDLIPYLNQCRVQVINGTDEYITALEHFSISICEPALND